MSENHDWINNQLLSYLQTERYKDYHKLINIVVNYGDIDAKYNLFTLFMEHGTEKVCVDNLRNLLQNLYSQDPNLENYLDKIIYWNPLFATLSISASHKLDERGDYSKHLDIHLRDNSKEAVEKEIKHIKEVLRMIITETKTIKL